MHNFTPKIDPSFFCTIPVDPFTDTAAGGHAAASDYVAANGYVAGTSGMPGMRAMLCMPGMLAMTGMLGILPGQVWSVCPGCIIWQVWQRRPWSQLEPASLYISSLYHVFLLLLNCRCL